MKTTAQMKPKSQRSLEVKTSNFRDILIHELQSRMQRNPAYSMRSFARDLGLASSGLSRVLNGQQGLSLLKAKHISRKIDLSELESDLFCAMVESEYSRSEKQRALANQRLQNQKTEATELSLDFFKAISDWHYFALLALTEVSDFESDERWIADRMGISTEVVREAIARLIKIELLEYSDAGILQKTNALVTTPTGVPSRAIKSHHQQILKKAEAALFEQDVSEREFAGISLAMDQDDLSWAKSEMQKFRRELAERLAKRKSKNRLYHLSMQLFALDTLTESKKGKK